MAKVLLKGTKTRTAEQIADQIEAVGGSISSDAGNNSFSVSLDVTKPDLKLGVDLLSDVLLNATMPEKAIAREKEVQIAGDQAGRRAADHGRAQHHAAGAFSASSLRAARQMARPNRFNV